MGHDLSYLQGGFVINDRYEVRESLGAGGFAVVYAGRDTQIDRSVAIKVMNTSEISTSEKVHTELVERFEREATLAAKVEHPNVTTIFDYGVVDEHEDPFIVMELMEGRDLEEQLADHGPMAADRALELMTETLVAVGLAHEAGIVHKDIKPSNLFLKNPGTRLETLSILDFGVAHIAKAVRSRLTQAGELTGTPGYIPPEYASDQIVSPPLDVYQMGLVLVEVLTGEMVVAHSQPSSALLAHVQGELPLPVAYLESPLGPILCRALAVDPEDRYPNGLAFADDLAELSPEAVPELEEEPDKIDLSDYVEEHGRPAIPEPSEEFGERATKAGTRHMYGIDEPGEPEAANGGSPAQTQFMYGGPSDAGDSGDGDTKSPVREELENAPTLSMEESREPAPAPDRDGSEANSREIDLGTRFEIDEPGLDGPGEPTAYSRRGGSGSWLVGVAAVLLAGGGLAVYLGVGFGGSPAPAGTDAAAGASGADEAAAAGAGSEEDDETRADEREADRVNTGGAAGGGAGDEADPSGGTESSAGSRAESGSAEAEETSSSGGQPTDGEPGTSTSSSAAEAPPAQLGGGESSEESAPQESESFGESEAEEIDEPSPSETKPARGSERSETDRDGEGADEQTGASEEQSDDESEDVDVKLPSF